MQSRLNAKKSTVTHVMAKKTNEKTEAMNTEETHMKKMVKKVRTGPTPTT